MANCGVRATATLDRIGNFAFWLKLGSSERNGGFAVPAFRGPLTVSGSTVVGAPFQCVAWQLCHLTQLVSSSARLTGFGTSGRDRAMPTS